MMAGATTWEDANERHARQMPRSAEHWRIALASYKETIAEFEASHKLVMARLIAGQEPTQQELERERVARAALLKARAEAWGEV
jgi:hypothetical protein